MMATMMPLLLNIKDIQQLLWMTYSPDPFPIKHIFDMRIWLPDSISQPTYNLLNCVNRCKRQRITYHRMAFAIRVIVCLCSCSRRIYYVFIWEDEYCWYTFYFETCIVLICICNHLLISYIIFMFNTESVKIHSGGHSFIFYQYRCLFFFLKFPFCKHQILSLICFSLGITIKWKTDFPAISFCILLKEAICLYCSSTTHQAKCYLGNEKYK